MAQLTLYSFSPKVREDTEWERCSRRPATANAVKLKNRGERQRLEVVQLSLDRELARQLRRIELDRSELALWWRRRVTKTTSGGPRVRFPGGVRRNEKRDRPVRCTGPSTSAEGLSVTGVHVY